MKGDVLCVRGGTPLAGGIRVAGFKHALVPVLAAAVMSEGRVRIANAPDIEDTRVLCDILCGLGADASFEDGAVSLRATGITSHEVPIELARRIHGSLYLLPSLLATQGRAVIGETGGCLIGSAATGGRRPIHHTLHVLERFGATFEVTGSLVKGRCARLRGTTIDIRDYSAEADDEVSGPLVSGATKTALLAAATAQGTTVIRNPYRKPDVTELVAFMTASGIPVADENHRILVDGRPRLLGAGHALPSDLIEVMTLIAAVVHLGADIEARLEAPERTFAGLAAELGVLSAMGVQVGYDGGGRLQVVRSHRLRPQDIVVKSTTIYSDNQPFFALMLTAAEGPSHIEDRVWGDRFGYASQLVKLGARMKLHDGQLSVLPGRPHRSGASVTATELRGAAVLLLAALGIEGETQLHGMHHLSRGYEDLVGRLARLGATIMRS